MNHPKVLREGWQSLALHWYNHKQFPSKLQSILLDSVHLKGVWVIVSLLELLEELCVCLCVILQYIIINIVIILFILQPVSCIKAAMPVYAGAYLCV